MTHHVGIGLGQQVFLRKGLDTYMGDFGRLVVRELTKPNDKEAKNG